MTVRKTDNIFMEGANAQPGNEPVVCVSGLTVNFGQGNGVFNCSLSVPRGSVLGLIGRNGAGKTTLVKTLTGMLRPDCGKIQILGMNPVTNREGVMASTGFVDEDKALYEWMTVNEILEFNSRFFPTWDQALVQEMLEKAELRGDSSISSLSRGAKAEVALIMALAHRPELLIMDEPTSGLDILVRHDFLDRLISFACSGVSTVIFSSHILEDVERVCDSVAIMEAGRIICHENLDDLKAKYLSTGAKTSDIRDIFIDTIRGKFDPREGRAA